ncbi:MAG: helix-turn-helix domain-containing protein [Lachnospiraceae bacterium]
MAVELKDLYAEIKPHYEVKLHTKSCFQKRIGWIHMVESGEFARSLYGDELVFNSGLNYISEEWLRDFIAALNYVHAGGLVVALRDGHLFSKETIDYCNEIKFPLFSASWDTPYMDIMRLFSEILLRNEQRDTNLVAALKNVIYYPKNEALYLNHFESNGFFRDMEYVIMILSCNAYATEDGNEKLKQIEKELYYILKNGIMYEEEGRLIILVSGGRRNSVEKQLRKMCGKDSNIYMGIGPTVTRLKDIHNSYEKAYTAYQLTKTAIPKNILSYEDLGIYKILADAKESAIYPAFVKEILGKLMDYDKENDTDYMQILEAYFENECSIVQTAKALYCHKNTMSYKLNKIKDILGYDILSNENRTKIMLSFYILRLGAG